MDEETSTDGRRLTGEMLAPGAATGRLAFLESDFTVLGPDQRRASSIEQELDRFEEHIDGLAEELIHLIAELEAESADIQAQIVRTHLYLIQDHKFHQDVCREIRENALSAETAIETVLRRVISVFERSRNTIMVERASDIRDIIARLSRRVQRRHHEAFAALGEGKGPPNAKQSVGDPAAMVLAVKELLPSVVLEARNSRVVGFVVERGTGLSHGAILAKSLGFPVLRIDDLEALQEAAEETVLISATDGSLVVAPQRELILQIVEQGSAAPEVDEVGLPVRLWINVADPVQVTPELAQRIAGVGLYRTEVLFMEQIDDFPSEEQQYLTYRSLFETCRPDQIVTVRTADIGGDKTLSYFPLGPQENPSLGVRANRVYREHPEIFITQMRAILRAAADSSGLRIMYPMIGSREDLLFIERLLAEAVRSLRARRQVYQDQFEQGIMIEVPSAAWNAGELLEAVDFASVGTNDLLQYFFAVGRDDAHNSQSYRTLDPAALRMLRDLVEAAALAGKPLSICGEVASDPQLLPLLIGLGFRDLSVDIRFLPQVEESAAGLDVAACEQLAQDCLKAKTSREVRGLLSESGLVKKHRPVCPSRWDQAVDPICGAVVDTADIHLTIARQGRKIHFCSARCRDEYIHREKQGRTPVAQAS
jgi:phosphoenolpyruvate-protein phosphotransferase